ncbi:L-fuco-beta-pyranose dehydrogenase [Labilithrix luteola]|uniref:L-fuco-beta-pyranose dehydrogenase n=1 Tax=Labilithrix luteola TaxID=1391654 RepID=A0A0K1Q6E1_9BACT|nr:SDR family oxidoreductase [Labilithrix luteola]AKV00985.1 L-fuco-beta-pyranose dehydrogenase [Labilithrix luteola]
MKKFTPEELERCIEMLEALVEERTLLAQVSQENRVRLLVAAGRISRPTRHEATRTSKAFRKITHAQKQEHDRALRASTEIRTARLADVFTAPPQLVGSSAPANEAEVRELNNPRDCYVCKKEFTRLHFFYDSMCPECAELNYQKRFQTASLEGRVALITGARVKIGFHAALMMLRAGAHVIVTTRFPRDAAARFAREEDFAKWQHRIEVFGLDLRHSPSVEMFARYVTQTKSRLDILINNAAQTVRRPAGFYAHLLDLETRPFRDLSPAVQSVLRGHEECKSTLSLEARDVQALPQASGDPSGFVAWSGDGPGVGIRSSAMLSQVPCAYDDASRDHEYFPVGRTDADLQQIDLRTTNSWRLTLSEVPSPEMLEVQLVNAVAPFILCGKLKPLMMRDRTDEKHIVNVSAMEGQFARRTKTDKHPHTNMAKAALNMMTLTSAPEYAADGIFMNAVDTGWVTDEDAAKLAERKQRVHDFQPPLDIVDGAARICDPFFSGLLTGHHVWGKFLKDYAPTQW